MCKTDQIQALYLFYAKCDVEIMNSYEGVRDRNTVSQ